MCLFVCLFVCLSVRQRSTFFYLDKYGHIIYGSTGNLPERVLTASEIWFGELSGRYCPKSGHLSKKKSHFFALFERIKGITYEISTWNFKGRYWAFGYTFSVRFMIFGEFQVGQLYQKMAKNGEKTLKRGVPVTRRIFGTTKGTRNLIWYLKSSWVYLSNSR